MLVLPASSAARIWVLGASGRRRLVPTDDAVFEDADGMLVVRASSAPMAHEYRADLGRFEPLEFEGEGLGGVTTLRVGMPRPGEQPPAGFGERAGRASAPTRAQIALHGLRVEGPLLALDAVRLAEAPTWRELPRS